MQVSKVQASLFTLAVVLPVLLAATATAATWQVAKDGSGDFTVIQDAVDVAAPGDVIMVGPGRYEEFQIWNDGVHDWHIYVLIETDDLTIIGSGPDETIIGPVDDSVNIPLTEGVTLLNVSTFRMEQLSIDNVKNHSLGCVNSGLILTDCRFSNGDTAILGIFAGGLAITSCVFTDYGATGIAIHPPTPWANITDCTFTDCRRGMSADWSGSQNIAIRDCVFTGGVVGAGFAGGASGSIHDCQFTGQLNYGITAAGSGAVELVGNYVEEDGGAALFFATTSLFTVHDNVFASNNICIVLRSSPPTDFNGNHILRGPEAWFVRSATYWPGDPTFIDLSHNWWGTTDLDEIAEWIYDGYDDEDVNGYVVYEPILGGPVETEQTTWSELKNMYR